MKSKLLLLILICVSAQIMKAQVKLPSDEELFKQIAYHDSVLFHAYNVCDLEKFGSYFTEGMAGR